MVMVQSAALMMDWLAEGHDMSACADAAALIDDAVFSILAYVEVRPVDLGGRSTTAEITAALVAAIR